MKPISAAIAITAALAGVGMGNSYAATSADPKEPVKTALLAALDDEYRAEATYQAVLYKHGEVRPFSNIILAEQRHQQMAKAALDRRGWAYGANPYSGKIKAPATLLEACQIGVQAEVENIALYDRLLPTIDDAAARELLTKLQWASRENHLPAFERCVARGGTPGRGTGGGGGGGGRHGGW